MNYEELLEKAREIYESEDTPHFFKAWLLANIIGLADESDDEQSRKWILEYLFDGLRKSDEQFKGQFKTAIAWLEKQGEPEDKGEISDGYHTFNELYRYRMLYNAAFFNLLPKELVHKSKKHHDGEECFGGGWFIVMANLPTGQISNHYELKDWDLFQIPEKDVADEWDGHTPQAAADRLNEYLLEKQGEQTQFDYEHADIPQKDFAPIEHKMLNADDVIEWFRVNCWNSHINPIDKFKKDFGLMTLNELQNAWVRYRGEAYVTTEQMQAVSWAWQQLQGKSKLNADEVIEWIGEHVPTKFEDMANYVEDFKQYFGL